MKKSCTAAAALVVIIIVAAVMIRVSDMLPYRETESIYFDSIKEFDAVAEYFREEYADGISLIRYEISNNTLFKSYSSGITNAVKPKENDKLVLSTDSINSRYAEDNEAELYKITAYYDGGGKMIISIPIIRKKLNSNSVRIFSLIYADESYDIENSLNRPIWADNVIMRDNSFTGNCRYKWCTYSYDTETG